MHPELKKLYGYMLHPKALKSPNMNIVVVKEPYYWFTIYFIDYNSYITLTPND